MNMPFLTCPTNEGSQKKYGNVAKFIEGGEENKRTLNRPNNWMAMYIFIKKLVRKKQVR
jgi:hypothetical protein